MTSLDLLDLSIPGKEDLALKLTMPFLSSAKMNFSTSLFLTPLLALITKAESSGILTDPSATCLSLSTLSLPNTTINFVNYLPAGTNISLSQDYDLDSCGYVSQVISVDLCRVAMEVKTSERSAITLEVGTF